jgi:hypothetical protein
MNIEFTEKRKELENLSQRLNRAPIPKSEDWGGADVVITSPEQVASNSNFRNEHESEAIEAARSNDLLGCVSATMAQLLKNTQDLPFALPLFQPLFFNRVAQQKTFVCNVIVDDLNVSGQFSENPDALAAMFTRQAVEHHSDSRRLRRRQILRHQSLSCHLRTPIHLSLRVLPKIDVGSTLVV